eukprot:scaffold18.g2023.t1
MQVYDVTQFLDEHPGGYDIVVSNAGKDATEDFDEIGHSKTANEMLAQYLIGDFAGGDASAAKAADKKKAAAAMPAAGGSTAGTLVKAALPILLVAAAVLYAMYGQQQQA